jgi:predicted CoA-binding protein
VDEEAAERLEKAGIPVAMDRCILVERERLGNAGDREVS